MTESAAKATHVYSSGQLALEFLKRTRSELRTLRKVHVWRDRFEVFDINGDYFDVRGIGYMDGEIIPLLDAVNTAFKRESIHTPTDDEYKQFKTGRRRAWAEDRVM